MGRKIFLPLSQRISDSIDKPNATSMRKRLGGRLVSETAISTPDGPLVLGSLVIVEGASNEVPTSESSPPRVGVLLAISGRVVDVYLERGLVKRTALDLLRPFFGTTPPELATASKSATVFARLSEGQRVEIERTPTEVVVATLVEKCRYGALVELDDRSLLGVGFRKIWPKQSVGLGDERPS